MASSLHVQKLDDVIINRLKRRAARHGRSAEVEHREILRIALADEEELDVFELAAQLRELTKDRQHTPCEVLQREIC